MKTITRAKGGTAERQVEISQITIPDLWHVAQHQERVMDQVAILETWHLAHDMLRALKEQDK
jgi:hypothetical protein